MENCEKCRELEEEIKIMEVRVKELEVEVEDYSTAIARMRDKFEDIYYHAKQGMEMA